MRIAAVILDMDGLMVDTEPLYKSAWQRAARDLGHELDDGRYAGLVGRPTGDCERLLIGYYGAAFPLAAFRERWPLLWRGEVERVGITPKPGLSELLEFLETARLPSAVATSSEREYAEITLRLAGVSERFTVVVSGDEVARGKPAPDIYLEAARRLGVPAAACVALEDSEPGIHAASAAGMTGVLVPHWPATAEGRQAAFAVVDNLHEARDVLAALMKDS